MSGNEYYLATGDGLRVETGATTYMKGGEEADQQSFSWPAFGFTWHYSAPFALGRIYRTYNSLPEAFRGKTSFIWVNKLCAFVVYTLNSNMTPEAETLNNINLLVFYIFDLNNH